MKIRSLTRNDVKFTLEIESEVAEMHFDSGDTEADDKLAVELRRRLDRGDFWAWGVAIVRAEWNDIRVHTSLGCCSYKNEKNFMADGCYSDMQDECIDLLNAAVAKMVDAVSQLVIS